MILALRNKFNMSKKVACKKKMVLFENMKLASLKKYC